VACDQPIDQTPAPAELFYPAAAAPALAVPSSDQEGLQIEDAIEARAYTPRVRRGRHVDGRRRREGVTRSAEKS
jgi:hypothetical protein